MKSLNKQFFDENYLVYVYKVKGGFWFYMAYKVTFDFKAILKGF